LSSLQGRNLPMDKSRKVHDMFGAIAGRYDFLNHLLSVNFDRRWRQACVEELGKRIGRAHPRILDIGCGTADLSLAFSKVGPVIGCDFCFPMLQIGARKVAADRRLSISLLEADALALPFAKASFDIVVSAFVLRNLADMDRGLQEMRRVLRPGGLLGILEFGMPRTPFWGALYRWYFLRILPRAGKLISGVDGPYGYLPASVQAFPPAEELRAKIERAGFAQAEYRSLTLGVAFLLIGKSA
jgi:demethylmenaquinone methyltransferase / 2-methoxy-6-polyprenyl-1,4-benzoquinol methylase